MNTAQNTASVALVAIGALANSGTLVVYSGAMPATPETALSGNTALVTLDFTASAFNAPTYSSPDEQTTANFSASSFSPTTAGLANWARAYKSDGTTAVADFTVIAPYSASPVFTPPVGFLTTNAGNTYKATAVTGATAGVAPTGTTTSTDGGVTWTYQGAGTLGDVVISNPNVQTGVPFTSPTMTLKMPAL